jgi:hypothetical protein
MAEAIEAKRLRVAMEADVPPCQAEEFSWVVQRETKDSIVDVSILMMFLDDELKKNEDWKDMWENAYIATLSGKSPPPPMKFEFGYKSEFTSKFVRKVLEESFKASDMLGKEFVDETEKNMKLDEYIEKIKVFRNILTGIAEVIPKSDSNQAVIKGYLDATV